MSAENLGRMVREGHIVRCSGYINLGAIADSVEIADRIAHCWNAFDGVPTKAFEGKSLEEYVSTQAYLHNLTPSHSGLEVGLSGLACQLLAASFAGQFEGTGATNFLEINMEHPSIGEFSVTIQKTSGLTPAALKARAEAELASVKAVNAELLAALVIAEAEIAQVQLQESHVFGNDPNVLEKVRSVIFKAKEAQL